MKASPRWLSTRGPGRDGLAQLRREFFLHLSPGGAFHRCYRGQQAVAARKRALQAVTAAVPNGGRQLQPSHPQPSSPQQRSAQPCCGPPQPVDAYISTRSFQLTAHLRYGGSRGCLEIVSACAVAKSATWSAGYHYLWTLHATLVCLYVCLWTLCRAPAAFVSAMAYRETAIVQDTVSLLGMRCTGLFESYFLLCPESLTNSKHVPAGAVLPRTHLILICHYASRGP